MSDGAQIYAIIVDEFEKTVRNAHVNSELKRAVLDHERKNKFLYNITREVAYGKSIFTTATIREATRDLTNIFMNNAERFANERIMSQAEKRRILAEDAMNQEVNKQADEWADQIEIEHWDGKKKNKGRKAN